jgi:hypothetical protein
LLTAWVKGLTMPRQEEILSILQAKPKSCVVYYPALDRGMWGDRAEDLAASPLATYIVSDMRKVYERGGLEIRVHPRRDAPWSEPAPPLERPGAGN